MIRRIRGGRRCGEDGRLQVYPGDISGFDFGPWAGKVDVVSGGVPCQPWSQAGRKRGWDDERNMWPQFIRAVAVVGPKVADAVEVLDLLAAEFRRDVGDTPAVAAGADGGAAGRGVPAGSRPAAAGGAAGAGARRHSGTRCGIRSCGTVVTEARRLASGSSSWRCARTWAHRRRCPRPRSISPEAGAAGITSWQGSTGRGMASRRGRAWSRAGWRRTGRDGKLPWPTLRDGRRGCWSRRPGRNAGLAQSRRPALALRNGPRSLTRTGRPARSPHGRLIGAAVARRAQVRLATVRELAQLQGFPAWWRFNGLLAIIGPPGR